MKLTDQASNLKGVRAAIQRVKPTLTDVLGHFGKDGPGWRLAALLICRLGPIMVGATGLLYALKAIGAFH